MAIMVPSPDSAASALLMMVMQSLFLTVTGEPPAAPGSHYLQPSPTSVPKRTSNTPTGPVIFVCIMAGLVVFTLLLFCILELRRCCTSRSRAVHRVDDYDDSDSRNNTYVIDIDIDRSDKRHLKLKAPAFKFTREDNPDDEDDHVQTCAICLEDFVVGEKVKTVPSCTHTFHAHCIDEWTRRGSLLCHCPVCRSIWAVAIDGEDNNDDINSDDEK